MKRYLLLALTAFVPVVVSFGSGCKKTVPTVEAGVDTAALVVDADVPAVVEADAAPAATLAATHTVATAVKSAAPAVGPFQATYTCFGGMTVAQSGNNVTARQKPGDPQNYATVACTANGDTCDGATTIFAAGKPSGTKHSSLKRAANGDVTYKADGEAPTMCHKSK